MSTISGVNIWKCDRHSEEHFACCINNTADLSKFKKENQFPSLVSVSRLFFFFFFSFGADESMEMTKF